MIFIYFLTLFQTVLRLIFLDKPYRLVSPCFIFCFRSLNLIFFLDLRKVFILIVNNNSNDFFIFFIKFIFLISNIISNSFTIKFFFFGQALLSCQSLFYIQLHNSKSEILIKFDLYILIVIINCNYNDFYVLNLKNLVIIRKKGYFVSQRNPTLSFYRSYMVVRLDGCLCKLKLVIS